MTDAVRLLVRADDAGSSWSSNIGCMQACSDGIARSVEVMIPGPWVTHAAQVLNACPDIDVGIHLTLTSEWDAVRWRPLTYAPSLVDADGYFLPLLMLRDGDARPCLAHHDWSLEEIAAECAAQIELGRRMFRNATHISCHMTQHFKLLDPRLGSVIAELCAKYGLRDDAFGYGLPRFQGYPPQPRETDARVHAFLAQLEALTPGTYVFIDHPAVASPELAATGHAGYRDVLADRTTCLQVLTDRAVKERIEALGIELISYADL
ncbi:ChbG/HpnK family deacetylase [uncultured Tateyamaria sp.]|uniref:ChbG/HpnK family deacetylase n=1 Tax=uncultured Tateyamaria sp. TaxID=455651 RepID=UPI0026084FE6|nr:ChbG/HpnK family deacetylase [uncultured Tateyamaria sp.]